MIVAASVTDQFVTIATHFIRDVGLPGVFVLMAAAATAIPFPSEATMLFAGFNVHEGHQTMVGVVIAGVLGDLFGATVAYSIGFPLDVKRGDPDYPALLLAQSYLGQHRNSGGLLYNHISQISDLAFKFRTTITRSGHWHYKGTRRRREPNNFRALPPVVVSGEPKNTPIFSRS